MLRRRFYYHLKPYLPWSLRMAMRRWVARRTRAAHADVWPINPATAPPPEGWTGWPEGKAFAFVITHDVEGPDGLDKCQALAELEGSLGFRSSFNFIPEGSYTVPPSLRGWLGTRGFEVGVHDLHHDGKLFNSHAGFRIKARRINDYLRTWQASGYRSGFMLRNLDWYHDLEILYDASTFDTDPFEPQPDGAGTIFPFWIPAGTAGIQEERVNRPSPGTPDLPSPISNLRSPISNLPRSGAGYVELPYTLPQDSTLFLLLAEKSPEIWLRKLDWVASRGGMALVNVHPDYLRFPGEPPSPKTFPVEYYAELLKYVRERHEGRYWHALPRDVAAMVRTNATAKPMATTSPLPTPTLQAPRTSALSTGTAPSVRTLPEPASGLRGKRAIALLYSYYPADPRPRRAAEALAESGMQMEMLCLRDNPAEPKEETIAGVQVRRLPMGKTRAGKLAYLWQYTRFIVSCFAVVAWRSLRRRYDLVHVHNMPDILVFAALPAWLRGAKVVLDLHDPMPELMTSIYGFAPDRWPVRILKFLERLSIGFAHRVLTVNEACRKIFSRRSCRAAKVEVIMNSPDEAIFGFEPTRPPANAGERFAIMYHGSIVERHGLDLAVEALAKIRTSIPKAELRIFGKSNPYLEQVLEQARQLGLGDAVHHLGPVDQAGIAKAIDECDVGIIPNRRSIFTELNTPTRIFEYLARGKPLIAPRAPGITDYFGPDDLVFFELGDAEDLARQLAWVARHPRETAQIVDRGQAVFLAHRWPEERRRFLGVVSGLLLPRPDSAAPVRPVSS